MSKSTTSRTGGSTPRRIKGISLTTCTIVLGVAASAALLSAYAVRSPESSAFAGSPLPVYVLAAAIAVAVVVLGTFLLAARRRRSRLVATLDWIQDFELTPQTFIEHPELDRRKAGSESLAIRTLRAQVRTLEQALEQEQERPTVSVTVPEQDPAAEAEAFRRDVTLTLRALARRTADDECPRHTLARATAAVERLGAPEAFSRPVLAPAATVHALPTGRAALRQVPAVPVEAAVEAEPTLELPETAPELPETTDVQPEPHAPTADEPEVVLPVPALSNDHDTQRGRRWFRRTAA